MTVTLRIKEISSTGNNLSETFRLIPNSVIPDGELTTDTALILDTFARQIVALTTNSYGEVILETTESVTEKLANGEG